MAQLNTYDAIQTVVNSSNPTDAQIKEAFREVLDALTLGGKANPILVLDQSDAPVDANVANFGGAGSRELIDGMLVAIRSGSSLKLYQRVAGTWKTYVAGP